ncbi:MAG: hypothetical protein AB8B50_15780 [Pirellulaceae bacterium]
MRTTTNARIVSSALAMLVLASIVGCGPDRPFETAPTSGSVTYNDVPLTQGIIRFVPLEGTPGQKTSVNIVSGSFAVDAANGPAVGEHRVEIESTDLAGLEMDDEDAIGRLKAARTRRIDAIVLPRQYNSRSQLRRTIALKGNNQFSFALESKKRRK